jgi:RimJ/RimL family protein N-acetyltransferase
VSKTKLSPAPITLETDQPGLKLVQMLTAKDDAAYFELQKNNARYWREFGNSIDESESAVTERRLEHGDGRFGIWLEGKLIGMVGYSTKRSKDEAEIGILLDEQATGHGYATAAMRTVTDYANQHFSRVYAEVAPDNKNSINLLGRAGYRSSGQTVKRDWGDALVFEAPDASKQQNGG